MQIANHFCLLFQFQFFFFFIPFSFSTPASIFDQASHVELLVRTRSFTKFLPPMFTNLPFLVLVGSLRLQVSKVGILGQDYLPFQVQELIQFYSEVLICQPGLIPLISFIQKFYSEIVWINYLYNLPAIITFKKQQKDLRSEFRSLSLHGLNIKIFKSPSKKPYTVPQTEPNHAPYLLNMFLIYYKIYLISCIIIIYS